MTISGKITITLKEYKELQDAKEKLDALEACGVDNWQGYDDAMDMLYSEDRV